ncbi:hypothetical protein D3C71_1447690 [compost metagenome]
MPDRFLKLDLALVDRDPVLLSQRFSNLLARNGAEQPAAFSGFRFHVKRQGTQLLAELLRFFLLLLLAALLGCCLILQCLHVAIGCRARHAARQQEVRCIAFRYFLDLSLLTLSFNILDEYHFHSNRPSFDSISASTSSSLVSASLHVPSSCAAAFVK